ncbi:hypothetical protein PVAND_005409 [Polypedilum vanderplanki]|uniref:Lipocalin n=1 Tax=Polypedilum vanderplanki TaxID=319348 RepID=A0A9J6BZW5_POLVA|nr:hypothetical protein PVAND_005409 [Polypedilum vanderplanki]
MANTLKAFLFALVALAIVSKHETSPACANVTTMPGLTLMKLLNFPGLWYGIKGGRDLYLASGQCLKTTVTASLMTTNVTAYSIKLPYKMTNFIMYIDTTVQELATKVSIKSWILDTDFKTYLLIYQCGTANYTDGTKNMTISTPMLLSRTPTLPATAYAPVNTALGRNKMNMANLSTTFGTCNCFEVFNQTAVKILKMNKSFTLAIVCVLINGINSQKNRGMGGQGVQSSGATEGSALPSSKPCIELAPTENFDVNTVANGKWNLLKVYSEMDFKINQYPACIYGELSTSSGEGTLTATITDDKLLGKNMNFPISISIKSTGEISSIFKASAPAGPGGSGGTMDLNVNAKGHFLDVDGNNAFVYVCLSAMGMSIQGAVIISRNKKLDTAYASKIELAKLDSVLSKKRYEIILLQENCI